MSIVPLPGYSTPACPGMAAAPSSVELGAAPPGPAPHRQPAAPRRSSSCTCSAALWSGSGLRARRSAPRTSVVARVDARKVREREPDTRLQTLSTPPDHSKAVVSKRFYNYFSYRSLRCDRVSHAVRLRAHHGAALRCKSTLDVPCDTASTERTENARQRRTAPMPANCAVICTPRDRRNTEDWSSGL